MANLLARLGSGSGSLVALHARVVLHDTALDDSELPLPAIRPYPLQYQSDWAFADGMPVRIEPIRPEDEPLAVRFHASLSEQSVYQRYFQFLKLSRRVAHEHLAQLCFIDYDREMALVAKVHDPTTQQTEIIAVARLSKVHSTRDAEFSLMVSDHYQGKGLGTQLLRHLVAVARAENIERILCEILQSNLPMQRVAERVSFHLSADPGHPTIYGELKL